MPVITLDRGQTALNTEYKHGKGCIPGDNCAHGEAVKDRQCLEWLLGTSLEVKERVASLSGAPAALGSAGHWSSIPPCHNP